MSKLCTTNKHPTPEVLPACTEAPLLTPDHRGGPPWRRPALCPPASEPRATGPWPPAGSAFPRRAGGCKARSRAFPTPGPERRSCRRSPPGASNHSPAFPETEVGPPGMLAAAHLPPQGAAASAPSAPPSPPTPALLAIHSRPHFPLGRATRDRVCVQAKAMNSSPHNF